MNVQKRLNSPDLSPFSMDTFEFRQLGHDMVERLADYLTSLGKGAVYQPMPENGRMFLRDMPLPKEGTSAESIIAFLTELLLRYGRNQNDPRFSAFVDPAVAPLSILTMFLAAAVNNSGAGGDYAAIYLEEMAVRWIAQLIGFPTEGSDGVLLGGGSDANRHGLEVARYWVASRHGWNVREQGLTGHPRMILYASQEAHSCIDKAASTLGISVHRVATDQHWRMDVASLRAAIQADREASHLPAIVVANAGTVSTGAIDPLNALADVCQAEGLWLHVDGAFGGLGAADPQLAPLYKGIERANSVVLDGHKWLATAIGCSCLLVQPGDCLIETYKLVPSYLRFSVGSAFAGEIWYSHRSAEQTRPSSRALMVIANLMQVGREGMVTHIRRHLDLAYYLRSLIAEHSELELIASGPLPVVCFRVVPAELSGDEAALTIFNQRVLEQIQIGGKAFLAGVDITRGEEKRFALRYCNLNYAASSIDVEAILAEVFRASSLCWSLSLGHFFRKILYKMHHRIYRDEMVKLHPTHPISPAIPSSEPYHDATASGAVGADVHLWPRSPTTPVQARRGRFSSSFSPFLKKCLGKRCWF